MKKNILFIVIIGLMISCNSLTNNKQNNRDMNKKTNESIVSNGLVEASAKKVWNKLIDFGGTEKFVPNLIKNVLVKGKGIGAIRTIYLINGGKIKEELIEIDEENRKMKFIILSTPMPISKYIGTFTVKTVANNKCEVIFKSTYKVESKNKEEMKNIIKEFQKIFISNLNK